MALNLTDFKNRQRCRCGGAEACTGESNKSPTFGAFPALRDLTSSPWAAMLLNSSSGEVQDSPLDMSAIFWDLGLPLASEQMCSAVETRRCRRKNEMELRVGSHEQITTAVFPSQHFLPEKCGDCWTVTETGKETRRNLGSWKEASMLTMRMACITGKYQLEASKGGPPR